MKKKLLPFIALVLFASILTGQSIIVDENFDSFNAGDKLVQTVNNQSVWDTWSSAPGGGEDAAVSNAFSNSPDNSILLANNNDIVLLFDDLTEGRYQVNFKLLIESGKIGYFNMLHEFAGGDSEWAFQVYYNAGGTGTVDAGKTGAATFDYAYDTWKDINVIVDLDDDFATFYQDGVEVISWKWSLGTSGGGTKTKLDAINFYGNSSGGTSGMYIDDVIVSLIDAPEAPGNLTATVEEESKVILNWDVPSNPPQNYVLSRNSEVIEDTLTGTEYIDIPYPGSSNYNVRAHYLGAGYSHGSNEVEAIIPGGLDREYVLFEIGTGTGCPFCPGASMGAVDMVENGDEVIIIKYHNFNASDPFNTPASAERAGNYYAISGYPTSFADGTLSAVGGSSTQSLFTTYHQHYTQRIDRKALYSVDVNVFHLLNNDYRAEVSIQQHSAYNGEQKTVHTALTESDIDFAWQNQSQVHWTCRNMYPDAFGTAVDFSDEETQSMTFDFTLGDDWVKDNCEFVVFLQADPSKEVMVATKVDLEDVILNQDKLGNNTISIYPNPASGSLYLSRYVEENFELTDLSGKSIRAGKTGNRIDISGISPGFYVLKIADQEIRKIIIE